MIALLYLALLVAWAVFVMVLRCKRAKAQRESETAATAAAAAAQLQIIQIESNLYDIHPTSNLCTNCQEESLQNCTHVQTTLYQRHNYNVGNSNCGFIPDEMGIHPAGAPPTYDEVMRLPNIYPQLISNNTSSTISQPTQTDRNDSQVIIPSISLLTTNNTINRESGVVVEPSINTNNKTL